MQAQFDFGGLPGVVLAMTEAEDAMTPTEQPAQPFHAAVAEAVDVIETAEPDEVERIFSDRLWCDDGWTARVIKNEDDDGWAVAMFKDGEAEPALVGPWTMGRDKKNPKPLDPNAFGVLVKTATEVLRRHEQQLHALLHKSVFVTLGDADLNVTLDIKPSEDDPHAILSAYGADGTCLARVRATADFKLDRHSALKWAGNDFRRPA